ncbi:HNH endonuclease [Flavobacterium agrisoli]|uniref:HNH endonuclease 5 domain-containing protein n=1 Tax=Flavobacterium agrisoli TaxID=2793066 RepID=A0A934PIY7_9FLAO|nr:hypothetical protein [Flavobacterium agrisoli]
MVDVINNKSCLWCLKKEPDVTFIKKAHTIPKSLGGQNYNKNVCDDCMKIETVKMLNIQ